MDYFFVDPCTCPSKHYMLLDYCWASVADGGTTLNRHLVIVLCFVVCLFTLFDHGGHCRDIYYISEYRGMVLFRLVGQGADIDRKTGNSVMQPLRMPAFLIKSHTFTR